MPDDDLIPDDPRWAYAFTIEEAGEIGDRPGVLLRGSREAVKAAARMFAEAVVVVPVEPSEAPNFQRRNREEAIAAWNRRAVAASTPAPGGQQPGLTGAESGARDFYDLRPTEMQREFERTAGHTTSNEGRRAPASPRPDLVVSETPSHDTQAGLPPTGETQAPASPRREAPEELARELARQDGHDPDAPSDGPGYEVPVWMHYVGPAAALWSLGYVTPSAHAAAERMAWEEGRDAALSRLLPMIPVGAEQDARRFIAALTQETTP